MKVKYVCRLTVVQECMAIHLHAMLAHTDRQTLHTCTKKDTFSQENYGFCRHNNIVIQKTFIDTYICVYMHIERLIFIFESHVCTFVHVKISYFNDVLVKRTAVF